MLGSITEAEDAVQDAGLRWLQVADHTIDNPEAWLVSVATRICVDRLRRLATQRKAYVGWWLPEPFLGAPPPPQPDSALHAAADLSVAFLTILERLSPEERAVFVLREVLDQPFAEIAATLGKSEVACRQLARRARTHVQSAHPRFPVSREVHEALLRRFLSALEAGDQPALVTLLADGATLTSDGGGKVRVSQNGIHGAVNIIRLIVFGRLVPKHLRQTPDRVRRTVVEINGEAGVVTFVDGRLLSALSIRTDGARIHGLYQMLNPDKLAPLLAAAQ